MCRDKKAILAKRTAWVNMLARDTSVRSRLRIAMTRDNIDRRIHHITSRTACRKAAALYDRWGTIATLDFMLFRFEGFILMSPADVPWAFVVLDERFEVVANLSIMQE